jgi:hypothetical protein
MEKVEVIKTAVQSHEVPELYQVSLTQSGRCEGFLITSGSVEPPSIEHLIAVESQPYQNQDSIS